MYNTIQVQYKYNTSVPKYDASTCITMHVVCTLLFITSVVWLKIHTKMVRYRNRIICNVNLMFI